MNCGMDSSQALHSFERLCDDGAGVLAHVQLPTHWLNRKKKYTQRMQKVDSDCWEKGFIIAVVYNMGVQAYI